MVYNRTESYTYTSSDVDVEIYDYYKGVTVPELSTTNNFLYGADAVAVNNTESNKDNKVFVVSANANAVHFAPGNLKCTKTGVTWADGYEWSFMEHQYDMVETNATSYCTDNYGSEGRYWTSTQAYRSNNTNYATYVGVNSSSGFSYNEFWRAEGYSVRLVR